MLYTTTLITEHSDRDLSDLGIKKQEIKYYPIQFDLEDVEFHHGFDHETDDGNVEASIVQFYNGGRIAILEPFNKLQEARYTYASTDRSE